MSLETQITQLSVDDLDKFFESTPDTTVTADDAVVVKQANEKVDDIPFLDETEEVDETTETTRKEVKKESVKKEVEETEKVDKTENTTEEVEKQDEEVVEEEQIKQINTVLKNTVDYLIQTGEWVDFEGREDLEITQEVYAELVAKQNAHKAASMFEELVDATGDYGKAIISHIKQGGNPDEIIDLFKEQKQLEQIDTTTETGKQKLIESYYREVLNWKPEKIEKVVKRLIADNEIDSEFQDAKEAYDQHYKERLSEINNQVKETVRREQEKQQRFEQSIMSALEEDKNLTPKEKKLLSSSILDFRHKLDNGKRVNDFYIKFAEFQSDPKKYIELVKFVMDPDGYKQSLQKKIETKVSKETFNFIKGNSAVSKNKTSVDTDVEKKTEKRKGTDFSFFLNK